MSAPNPIAFKRPIFEVADIFSEFADQYQEQHVLSHSQKRIIWDITHCRTLAFGGHLYGCDYDGCDHNEISYNSCRNRHCPKCQALKKARWLEARMLDLLPVGYFHNVFTLPHKLNPLILRNKKVMLNLLFRAVKETLQEFAKNPDHKLEGQLGFTCILHTWDQKLNAHFHLHVIIPAGALSKDQTEFRPSKKKKWLFPVTALSKKFRGKYLDFVQKAYNRGELEFSGKCEELEFEPNFKALKSKLYKKNWVVYSKAPFKGAKKLFDYLGRYTHRVAISNDRISNFENGEVTFTYKDRNDNYTRKEITLPAERFIDRFLLHELPGGFMKIRYFGFLSSGIKAKKLKIIRELLGLNSDSSKPPKKSNAELILELTGVDIRICPKCKKGNMIQRHEFGKPFIHSPWFQFVRKTMDRFFMKSNDFFMRMKVLDVTKIYFFSLKR